VGSSHGRIFNACGWVLGFSVKLWSSCSSNSVHQVQSLQKYTSEERILAVLCHLSALAFGMGLIIPVVLWSGQQGRSKYAAFQALQAYGYQSLGYTIWTLTYLLLIFIMYVIVFFVGLSGGSQGFDYGFLQAAGAIFMALFFALFGGFTLAPIIGAVACALGRDFHYPFMGRLAPFLRYDSPENRLDSQAEEHWLAAMGHFCVIIPVWGILGALFLWGNAAKRSAYLKIQSAQTVVFQLITNLLFFGLTLGLIVFAFIALYLSVVLSQMHDPQVAVVAGALVVLCITAVILLTLPLFHILGQWAGLQVLQGNDFRYPVLGRLLEQRFNKVKKE